MKRSQNAGLLKLVVGPEYLIQLRQIYSMLSGNNQFIWEMIFSLYTMAKDLRAPDHHIHMCLLNIPFQIQSHFLCFNNCCYHSNPLEKLSTRFEVQQWGFALSTTGKLLRSSRRHVRQGILGCSCCFSLSELSLMSVLSAGQQSYSIPMFAHCIFMILTLCTGVDWTFYTGTGSLVQVKQYQGQLSG